MKLTLGIALTALLALTGCNAFIIGVGPTITGSGVTKEEKREVGPFHGVDISSTFEATITIGPEPSVTLLMDDNVLPRVLTEVKEGRLEVKFARSANLIANRRQKVAIVVPSVDFIAARGAASVKATVGEVAKLQVESEGASKVDVDGLSGESIEVKANGVSRVTLAGQGKQLKADVNGASKLTAAGVSFETATVDVNGASHVEVSVTGSIKGDVSGASKLTVKGNPTTREVTSSGASHVNY